MYSLFAVENKACLLCKATPHTRMLSDTFGSLSINLKTCLLKLSDPVISPLTIDVIVPWLSWNCRSNEDIFAAKKGFHKIWYILLLNMLQELYRPTKVELAEGEGL